MYLAVADDNLKNYINKEETSSINWGHEGHIIDLTVKKKHVQSDGRKAKWDNYYIKHIKFWRLTHEHIKLLSGMI